VEANGPTYYVCGACLGERHEDCAGIYEPGTCACTCQHAAERASGRAHQQGRGRLRLIVSPGYDSHGQRAREYSEEAEGSDQPISSSWAPLLER
jgi:hypothetical protein